MCTVALQEPANVVCIHDHHVAIYIWLQIQPTLFTEMRHELHMQHFNCIQLVATFSISLSHVGSFMQGAPLRYME